MHLLLVLVGTSYSYVIGADDQYLALIMFTGSWSCHLCLALLKDKASIYQSQNAAMEWRRNRDNSLPWRTRNPDVHAETHLNCCGTFLNYGEAGREIIAPNITIVFDFYFAMTVTHHEQCLKLKSAPRTRLKWIIYTSCIMCSISTFLHVRANGSDD